MYGVVGFWGWPRDEDLPQFETDYVERYVPAVNAVPGSVRTDLFKADESGRESDLYRVGGIYFADEADYVKASATAQWAAMFALGAELIEKYGLGLRFANVTD